ncbi:MAG: hypothetical protein FWB87_04145 [Defluviitaleaceae bacterium]|nr:hypothetical protein [Defluviitaleaceae bacterium]
MLHIIVLLAVIFVGMCALQAYLSRREKRWLGLVLPVAFSIVGAVVVLGIMVYISQINTGRSSQISISAVQYIFAFVVLQVPAGVFLLIYKTCYIVNKKGELK